MPSRRKGNREQVTEWQGNHAVKTGPSRVISDLAVKSILSDPLHVYIVCERCGAVNFHPHITVLDEDEEGYSYKSIICMPCARMEMEMCRVRQ